MSSDWRCDGTNRMRPMGIQMKVDVFLWPRLEAEFHGVSSYIGRVKKTKNGVSLLSDDASE